MSYIDRAFRLLGAGAVPSENMARLYDLGIPQEKVTETLKAIHGLDEWSREWVETAQSYLGQSRREISAGNRVESERARYMAAMCYHAAQIMELRSSVTRDRCRSWASRLAALALPVVFPHARSIEVPWRDQVLPALFEAPEQVSGPVGLVIMLNGLSMCKEETFRWAPRFLEAGYAVLSIDSPGTGEATSLGPINANYNDILSGVFSMFAREPGLDLERVFVLGASLGGNEAIRFAQRDTRVLGAVVITPAVSPRRWMKSASQLLRAELADVSQEESAEDVAESYDAMPAAEKLLQPILVFGAGRDLVVPPNESQWLAAVCGDAATLVWYPELGHCLYAARDLWTAQAAAWIAAVGEGSAHGVVAAEDLAEIGRLALENLTVEPLQGAADEWDDDFEEFARIIPPTEADR